MSARQNLRDIIGNLLPSWLAEGDPENSGYGYRVIYGLSLIADGFVEVVASAALTAVGRGLPIDNDLVAQARGLIRHQDETEDDFARRLGTWIDRAKENGNSTRLALAIHDYLRSHPRIRIFRRDGWCITVNTDRSVTVNGATAWDWDSVSHPSRNDPAAPWWSDLFLVVYTTSGTSTQWSPRGGMLGGMTGDDGYALGQLSDKKERDDIQGLRALCKAAHTCLRAIIWCSDTAKFNPASAPTMPDGTWGAWSITSGGHQIPSGRDLATCRFWEQGRDR
jgi:hypothetical protein